MKVNSCYRARCDGVCGTEGVLRAAQEDWIEERQAGLAGGGQRLASGIRQPGPREASSRCEYGPGDQRPAINCARDGALAPPGAFRREQSFSWVRAAPTYWQSIGLCLLKTPKD